ncbi:MAG: imidazoleglycerol-phosphate dehydratase HisB [Spirochaetales bacterium]|nr:imidazoleglycerol-phosphate dehydratase HisB [Spirochaetales bacterium]MBO6048500.1 imidazoleglycerol-phosphate dehydratase HisB [Spirochaetales bacterium]MBP5756743.1 imidazoleglycerol-phosphate dehydratase HisB [Spirochaetales bacterium]
MRSSEIARKTAETNIRLSLNLDGTGKAEISTGVGFLDHMLTLFARHGKFDLGVTCKGDTCVDDHHSVEDIGIALGQAFRQALGEKRGIFRYGDITLPMDEALVLASVDISGRAMLCCDLQFRTEKIGDFDTELVEEFFQAFCSNAAVTLHIRQLAGKNSHHIAEATFKAVSRALRKAVAIDPEAMDEIPSTKGVL